MITRSPSSADTSPDADAVQLDAYRRMSGAERLRVAYGLNELTRHLTMAGIRQRHPEYDDEQVLLAFARLRYGDDLVRSAWPGRALVEP